MKPAGYDSSYYCQGGHDGQVELQGANGTYNRTFDEMFLGFED